MLKKKIIVTFALAISMLASQAHAKSEATNQVYFKGGFSLLSSDRAGGVFTDTLTGANNGRGGFTIGAGLDIGLTKYKGMWDLITLQGELAVDYSRFSNRTVVQATSALLGTPKTTKVPISELSVGIAPKIRFELGRFRPYVAPIGLSFLVVSPPSNNTTYLDLGLNFSGGVDIKLIDLLSVGIDFRYTHALNLANTHASYFSTGAYLGINF
ncbi:MAG: outer membrane beta-barrel protein [Deltaproteobacteria bacterium]|nr:outer membrane beta-barrel protein [Deltaproteobacteria bacterium]